MVLDYFTRLAVILLCVYITYISKHYRWIIIADSVEPDHPSLAVLAVVGAVAPSGPPSSSPPRPHNPSQPPSPASSSSCTSNLCTSGE